MFIWGSLLKAKGGHMAGTAGIDGVSALRDSVGGKSLEIDSQVPTAERASWQGRKGGSGKLGNREGSRGYFWFTSRYRP